MARGVEECVLRQEGEYWTLVYGRKIVRMRDSRGLHYLSRLLANAGGRLPATELVARNGRCTDAEHARVSVTKAIRGTLARIARLDPALGAHLAATLRTGTICSYHPDPRAPIAWNVSSGP